MNEICFNVSETTNETTVSLPCGKGDILWQFHIIFAEWENIKTRIVTVIDNGCGDRSKRTVQSKIVENENYRLVDFDYQTGKDDTKMKVKISVMFSKSTRLIKVSW